MASKTPTLPRRWISQAEAAEYLGVTPRTVRNMIRRGDIPAHRAGPRAVRIDVNELDRAIKRNRIPTTGAGAA